MVWGAVMRKKKANNKIAIDTSPALISTRREISL